MITLNDYLYRGDTVLKILHNYIHDLKEDALRTENAVDFRHCDFLNQIQDLLEHNDFLTSQSQRIREFYKYMAGKYPDLAFTFKGRIKSLIRAESKFNGYIVEYVYEYFRKNGNYPSLSEIMDRLSCFRDLIAYRIVISLPKCHLEEGRSQEQEELRYLYEIANALPAFLRDRGFRPEISGMISEQYSPLLAKDVQLYYRDYIQSPSDNGYRSLHITFYDESSYSYVEVQLRTKSMDDHAEIGPANHVNYEEHQMLARTRRNAIPRGECLYFDEAYDRIQKLRDIDLSKLDVNMFAARNNSLINDGCGLFRGRQILPFEHLSRFQNDLID